MHNRSRAASAGWRLCLAAVFALGAQLAPRPAAAGTSAEIRLTPLLPSGQPAGTTVAWTAGAGGLRGEAARYRFSVALDSGGWRVARDFSPDNFFLWTPLVEGSYQVQVTVQDIETGETRAATAPYLIRSRLSGLRPEAAATSHPLVLLFSAPPCPAGRVRVRFLALPAGAWQATPWQPCRPDLSLNVYVAGLRAAAHHPGIHFAGRLSRAALWPALGALDVLVLPTLWYETYSLAAHEALAAGLPVVASRLGVMPEVVRDGVDGLLFPPGDEAALAGILGALAEEPARLAALRANLRPVPTLAEHSRRLLELYAALAERGQVPGSRGQGL